MKTNKLIKSIALSSILGTALYADAATDAYIEYLLSQMYPNMNNAPTLALTSVANQSINLDNNETRATISFQTVDIDNDSTNLTYLTSGDTTYFDIVKNDTNLTVSLKPMQTIADGETKNISFNLVANDGESVSNSVVSTLTFANPENSKTAPVIGITTNANFDTNASTKTQLIKFDTNESAISDTNLSLTSLFVESNNTANLSAILIDNETIKLTRYKADDSNITVTLYATNSDGLTTSKDVNIHLPELNMPPYLTIPDKNLVVYVTSDDASWDKNISYSAYDYNGNMNNQLNVSNTSSGLTASSTNPNATLGANNEKVYDGNITLSGSSTGTFYVSINAKDNGTPVLMSNDENITVTVINANTAPVLSLPFTTISKLTQGNTSTKSFTLYDETDAISDLNMTVALSDGYNNPETNSSTSNLISVSDGKVKIDVDKSNKTVTATTLQHNSGVTYTISLSAKDPSNATTTTKTFTLTTEGANTALINSLIPVQMKDYSSSSCTPLYQYQDTNMSDSRNFTINYLETSDEIAFGAFNVGETNFSNLSLAYDSEYQAYGASSDTIGAAVKFEISQAGQFSGGRMMCVFTDSNTSNQTCWALATPDQKVALDNYESGYCN